MPLDAVERGRLKIEREFPSKKKKQRLHRHDQPEVAADADMEEAVPVATRRDWTDDWT